ncbi:hypothetical protein [Elizabethkingia anophelis]|uniref:hypothetical protein n=1 Tax=Elizabethkingia anophelis TaxID=1117645 RepID=UPI000998F028|nr:hypothetical protein [Elizabethkingia anophelis]MDV3566669.1 hypothetical protein [Elizabethkingia anophelis]MDV3972132.1 hypothetical protein [Elizabethkingia anophelis]PKR31097.1 hypothetical protein CWH99_09900 [Elizabethkingia anophelis]PKR36744.1 hypothetical protein CWI00_06380 [Elizabethkingia anophelis]PRQ79726.1 hypothetical protein CMT60_05700 [Elizabethkingia anophelis]
MKFKYLFIALVMAQVSFAQEVRTLKLRPFEKTIISDTLKESSGLTIIKGKLLSFNDSGNPAEIYELNPNNGSIGKTYRTNAVNIDWEAITNDGENIYVGDFGNNLGNRKDLNIYKIPFTPEAENLIYTSKINFFYPEQQDFSAKNRNNDFDAEAMIFLNGKIHLFTKEWKSKSVSHYIIDPTTETLQAAQKTESYQSDFVVTDATYYQGKLYLVGYTKGAKVYLLSCEETAPGLFFSRKIQKYFLGMTTRFGQIEGLTATEEGLYISGEQFKFKIINARQRLYFLPFKELN